MIKQKRFIFSIVLTSLFFTTTASSFTPDKTYIKHQIYKENPYMHLEKKLYNKPMKEYKTTKLLLFIVPSSIIIAILFIAIMDEVAHYSNRPSTKEIAAFSVFSGIFCGSILTLIYSYNKPKSILIEALRNFLENYDPDVQKIECSTGVLNNKIYTPKELHDTFDYLHKNYLDQGEKYLKGDGYEVLVNVLRTAFIK